MATIEVEPQRIVALRKADRIRRGGVAVKALLRAGELSVREAMSDPRAAVLPAQDLLRAQQRWGSDRARKALLAAGVSATCRVRDLTDRQRAALALLSEQPAGTVLPQSLRPSHVVAAPVAVPARLRVGFYRPQPGVQRTVSLVVAAGGSRLVDRGGGDERVVQAFGPYAGLLEIAAVAQAYLDERQAVA